MADDGNVAVKTTDNNQLPKKIPKKSTSKRRVIPNATKLSSSLADHHRNRQEKEISSLAQSSSPKVISIRERTVIGQEAAMSLPRKVEKNAQQVTKGSLKNAIEFSENVRSEADGSEDVVIPDVETEELSKLRCTSECTEIIAEREKRRRQRCADYPGLAFGSSIFSSDTLMKFSVIRNELHNILNSQLKRVSK